MRTHAQQKAGLTRAMKTGNPEAVLAECRRTVAEWRESQWPDDWSRWQRALDDVYPAFEAPNLENLDRQLRFFAITGRANKGQKGGTK
jgi:hypothetical protein